MSINGTSINDLPVEIIADVSDSQDNLFPELLL